MTFYNLKVCSFIYNYSYIYLMQSQSSFSSYFGLPVLSLKTKKNPTKNAENEPNLNYSFPQRYSIVVKNCTVN